MMGKLVLDNNESLGPNYATTWGKTRNLIPFITVC